MATRRRPNTARALSPPADSLIVEAGDPAPAPERSRSRRSRVRPTTKNEVATCALGTGEALHDHERFKNTAIARIVAELLGCRFSGSYDGQEDPAPSTYFIPHRTIIGLDAASTLGINSVGDFYGGIVPSEYLATKAITHCIVGPRAAAPEGWSDLFSRAVVNVVLPGYTAFSRSDARRATERLLDHGPVRVKLTRGVGGLGQSVVHSLDQLDHCLEPVDPDDLAARGVVIERNLESVATYSVGQTRIGPFLASYCGTQRLTTNNQGETVYGGSDLFVVPGGYDELLSAGVPDHLRLAITQAVIFDGAVRYYPSIMASRRNYDVAQGHDAAGKFYSGVLEQSWRIGGASGPEVVALRAFHDDPSVRVVVASSFEQYGADVAAPPGAEIHYQGVDPDCGPLTVYTTLKA